MKLYLDDQPVATQEPTLASAIRAGTDAAQGQGRIIVRVTLDGDDLSHEDLAEPDELERPDAEIRLTSAEPRFLVAETFQQAAELLDDIKAAQDESARLLQSGELNEALAPLSQALGSWADVGDAFDRSASLLQTPADQLAPDHDVDKIVSALARNLDEIKRCLGQQDWSALADVLAYELDSRVEQWQQMLDAASKHILSSQTDPPPA